MEEGWKGEELSRKKDNIGLSLPQCLSMLIIKQTGEVTAGLYEVSVM